MLQGALIFLDPEYLQFRDTHTGFSECELVRFITEDSQSAIGSVKNKDLEDKDSASRKEGRLHEGEALCHQGSSRELERLRIEPRDFRSTSKTRSSWPSTTLHIYESVCVKTSVPGSRTPQALERPDTRNTARCEQR